MPDQVRLATQFCENLTARLSGREAVNFTGDLSTFAKCYERIETALKVLKETDKGVVNQHADDVGPTQMGPGVTVDMMAATYAHSIALPNIYFHLNAAYGILRKSGVPLGKRDYYAGFAAL